MLEIWTSRGYFLVVTQFLMQFKHVSRHPRVSSRKPKKVLWKTVLKYGFRFVEKWPVDPQNQFQKKSVKTKKN